MKIYSDDDDIYCPSSARALLNDWFDDDDNEIFSDHDDIEYCHPPVQVLDDPFEGEEDLRVDISFFRRPLNVAAFDFVNTGMGG
ncbi:15845_t:CDS:2 [Entrophospora sp. SA101]|nr:15845_t:CDS:2 [Entrophospora sp. SA101]